MKNFLSLIVLLIYTNLCFSQKKDNVKGSKIVTIEQKQIGAFDALEVEDNLEVLLVKGEKCSLEIEADDNLHEVISINLNESTLRLTALRNVSSAKKFMVRVTFTDDFKMITAKNEATVNALAEIELGDIVFKSFDYAKLFLNAKTKNFTLIANDKSKTELNLKSENTTIEMSKNAHIKALISSVNMKFDLYQKSNAEIEGDIIDMKLRLDNNSDFIGKKLNVKNMEITAESYSNSKINVNTNLIVTASGNSEIEIYGDQKIELKKFADNAKLIKKPTK